MRASTYFDVVVIHILMTLGTLCVKYLQSRTLNRNEKCTWRKETTSIFIFWVLISLKGE